MREIINSQIFVAKTSIKDIIGSAISDDRAFSHVLLKNIYGVEYIDQLDLVTDGANDGGIDFLYYDEEENKVILSRSWKHLRMARAKMISRKIFVRRADMVTPMLNFGGTAPPLQLPETLRALLRLDVFILETPGQCQFVKAQDFKASLTITSSMDPMA